MSRDDFNDPGAATWYDESGSVDPRLWDDDTVDSLRYLLPKVYVTSDFIKKAHRGAELIALKYGPCDVWM